MSKQAIQETAVGKEAKGVTRRGFVAGGAAVTAATAAALTLGGCGSSGGADEMVQAVKAQFPDASVEYLNVELSQVKPHVEMNMVESPDYLYESYNFTLPLGSLLYQSSDDQALVVGPGASSKALIRLSVVNFVSGQAAPLLGQALGANEDYVIYDARASSAAIIWVECNMVHGLWRVYATTLENGVATEEHMSQAQLLDEGEGLYSPPRIAVGGGKVYWTVMPDPNGEAYAEDSYLKAANFGARRQGSLAEVVTVYTSHGRMITTPAVSGDILTFVPRVDTDAVFYQLTALDIKTDTVKNIAILPPSLRVSDAVWLDDGFAFGIEGNYNYAKGLALFGTYQQLSNGEYLYINKAPVSAALQMNGFTYIKSTKSVLGIDVEGDNVVVIDTLKDCVNYGDIMAGEGKQNRLVIYTTVMSKAGNQTGACTVRVFDHH